MFGIGESISKKLTDKAKQYPMLCPEMEEHFIEHFPNCPVCQKNATQFLNFVKSELPFADMLFGDHQSDEIVNALATHFKNSGEKRNGNES